MLAHNIPTPYVLCATGFMDAIALAIVTYWRKTYPTHSYQWNEGKMNSLSLEKLCIL